MQLIESRHVLLEFSRKAPPTAISADLSSLPKFNRMYTAFLIPVVISKVEAFLFKDSKMQIELVKLLTSL